MAGHSSPLAATTLPRAHGTPAHAHRPDVQLVPVPCPVLRSDEDWHALRVELVDTGRLHAREATMADLLPLARRGTFVGGRLAMRRALTHTLSATTPPDSIPPVLRNSRGAPVLPPGVSGSISHKRELALAGVVRQQGDVKHIGVDLEQRPTVSDLERPSIASRILTATERAELAAEQLDPLVERERVLVHFAVKEAVYKAIDPFVERYVGFTEVELIVDANGTAEVSLLLPEPIVDDVRVEAQWYTDGDWLVATAFSYR
jgi:phosphopantetheine--protein transferase-like protein